MNNKDFDAELRRKASNEDFTVNPTVEQKLRHTMKEPAPSVDAKPFRRFPYVPAVALLAVAAVLMVAIIAPHRDATHGVLPVGEDATITVSALTAGDISGSYTAEQTPSVKVDIQYMGQLVTYTIHIGNDTQSAWLLSWHADMAQAEQNKSVEADRQNRLLWVEAGKTCTDSIICKLEAAAPKIVDCHWEYTGYRVDSNMLFWVDSLLMPGDQDYQEQQSLLDDAFAAGSLMMMAEPWDSGEAGGVALVLPASFTHDNPDISALEYYLDAGALNRESAKACSRVWVEAAEQTK